MAIKDPFSGGNVGQILATRGGVAKNWNYIILDENFFFLTQPPYEAPPPDLVKILTEN